MSRERYIAEANHQLNYTGVYQQVSSPVIFVVIYEVKDILSRRQKSDFITEDMVTYDVPEIQSRLVYALSKWFIGLVLPDDLMSLLLDHPQVCQNC